MIFIYLQFKLIALKTIKVCFKIQLYLFLDTEMPSIMPIMLMEMNGFGMDSTELSRMKKVLQFQSALLEVRAFELAGRQFSLSSPKEIRQVFFKLLTQFPNRN